MRIAITITREMLDFLQDKIDSGRNQSIEDVLHDALLLLQRSDEQKTNHLLTLQGLWRQGVESGDAGVLDFTDLRETARRKLVSQETT